MSHAVRVMLALSVAAVVGGCSAATDPALPRDAIALEMRPFDQSVAQYFYSGISDRQRLVIDDAAEWESFWRRLTANVMPQPAVPAVDFASEMVIVAAMGTRPNGGYAIQIDEVGEANGRVHVVVREISPGRDCMVTAALTAPVVAVRIPRRSGPVTFIERSEVRGCE